MQMLDVTCVERRRMRDLHDGDGVIHLCGEYYMAGKEVWEHVPELRFTSSAL